MSGDSFKPDEGGEPIEVINPDEGNAEIEAQPEPGDAYDAAELEAVKDYTSTDDEATKEGIEPEQVEEDLQAEPDETTEAAEDEVEPESPKPVWDGNPENLPEELEPTYKSMVRGFQSKARELAEERKQVQDLQAKLLLRVSGEDPAQAEPEGPPPLPTGENITQDDWNAAVTKQNAWFAEQNFKRLEQSEKFVPVEKFAEIEQRTFIDNVTKEVEAMPGYSPEVETLMVDAMANDPFWAQAPQSREGMIALAEKAIGHVQAQGAAQASAQREDAKIKEKATAASRATPRVTTPKRATPEDVFAKNLEMTENERMEMAERLVREEYGD